MIVYLIKRNEDGQIEAKIVEPGQIAPLPSIIGKPVMNSSDLAAALISKHTDQPVSKADFYAGDFKALRLVGVFMWRFLTEPFNILTVTDDQINSLMEDLK